MATIDEMLAQPTRFGYIGGARKAEEDVRTQQKFESDQARAAADLADVQARTEDFLAGQRSRNAKYKATELNQQRIAREEKQNAQILDDQATLSINKNIQDLSSQLHSSQIEELGRYVGEIKNQKQYNSFLQNPNNQDLITKLGMKPTGNFKNDMNQLRYVQRVADHNASQRRAIELAMINNEADRLKARAAAAGKGGATPGPIKALGPGDEPLTRARLASDPFFDPIWKTNWVLANDPAQSQDLMAINQMVQTRTNGLMMKYDAQARADKNPNEQISQDQAVAQAVKEQKALMFKAEPTYNGQTKIVPMSIQEFNQQMDAWMASTNSAMEKSLGTNWTKLDPKVKQQVLYEAIVNKRMQEYNQIVREQNYGKPE